MFCLGDADLHFLGDGLDRVEADFSRRMRAHLLAVHVRHTLFSEFMLTRFD